MHLNSFIIAGLFIALQLARAEAGHMTSDQNCNNIQRISTQVPRAKGMSQPKDWDTLISLLDAGRMDLIGREQQMQSAYNLYRKTTDFESHAVEYVLGRSGHTEHQSFFLQTFQFGFTEYSLYIQYKASESNSTYDCWLQQLLGTRPAIRPASGEELSDRRRNILMLTANLFPYHIDPRIDHWILWSSDFEFPLSHADRVVSSLFNGKKYHLHLNEPRFRTIVGVKHFHLFVQED